MYRKFLKAIRHYNSLFPNNYLDVVELKDEIKSRTEKNSRTNMLVKGVTGSGKTTVAVSII